MEKKPTLKQILENHENKNQSEFYEMMNDVWGQSMWTFHAITGNFENFVSHLTTGNCESGNLKRNTMARLAIRAAQLATANEKLLHAGYPTPAISHFRSIFEIEINLCTIHQSEDEQIAEKFRDWALAKKFKDLKKLHEFDSHLLPKDQYEEQKKQYEELREKYGKEKPMEGCKERGRKRGRKYLIDIPDGWTDRKSWAARAEKARLDDEYQTSYSQASSVVHTDARTLMEEGPVMGPDSIGLDYPVLMTARTIRRIAIRLPEMLGIKKDNRIQSSLAMFDRSQLKLELDIISVPPEYRNGPLIFRPFRITVLPH